MVNHLQLIRQELNRIAKPKKAKILARFFKTGKGEYGEGDVFLGVMVPQVRAVAKKFVDIELGNLKTLLGSKVHEERLLALIILVSKYKEANKAQQKDIYHFYLENMRFINNWDLVDLSAEYIVGAYLDARDKEVLAKLARSGNIWERRIAMLSTFYYIKKGNPKEAFRIAEILIEDKHDLIQKAVGWMLREIGKKCSQGVEEEFLRKYYRRMPRVMLRYAIERFDEDLRNKFLKGMVN